MDMNINPVSGGGQQFATPSLKNYTGSTLASQTQPTPAQQPAAASTDTDTSTDNSSASSQSQYEAALRQAALSFKNTYAVSDQDFSIFKDATGKYITRYVSLRDGKVTYVPEPTLVKQLQLGNTDSSSLSRVAISA